jgi:hypothetical protein
MQHATSNIPHQRSNCKCDIEHRTSIIKLFQSLFIQCEAYRPRLIADESANIPDTHIPALIALSDFVGRRRRTKISSLDTEEYYKRTSTDIFTY